MMQQLSRESGAAGSAIAIPGTLVLSSGAASGTNIITAQGEGQRSGGRLFRTARSAALTTFLAAALPWSEIMHSRARRELATMFARVITAGDEIVLRDALEEDEMPFVVIPTRQTLWLADYLVPILPARKSFISFFGASDESE
jgi:hypothetical protein